MGSFMSVYLISEPARIQALFGNWPETFIWSYLQGCMGSAWADDTRSPRSAKIMVGDFCPVSYTHLTLPTICSV